MSQYVVTDTELTAVADAIRSKGGTEADLEWPSAFVSAIGAISGGGSGGGISGPTSITLENGGFDTNGKNSNVGSTRVRSTGFIECDSSKIYILKVEPESGYTLKLSVSFYSDDDFTISRSSYLGFESNKILGFIPPSGAAYFRVTLGRTNDETMTTSNVSSCVYYVFNESGSGGGEGDAKNILGGTTIPTSAEGQDGDIYIQTIDGFIEDLSDFSTYKETSMTVFIDADSIYFHYIGGQAIGAQVYKSVDLTNIDTIMVTVETDLSSYNNYQTDRFSPILTIENTINPASSFPTNSSIVSANGETYRVNTPGDSVVFEADVSNLTGNYYIVLSSSGATSKWSNLYYITNNGDTTIIRNYLKVNGTWVTMIGQDFSDVNTEGSGGPTNILSGTDAPTSSIGNDGSIYLQYDTIQPAAVAGGYADEAYVVTTTSQLLSTHSASFYKTNEGAAIAVEGILGSWHCPLLISDVADYAKFNMNESSTAVVVDGVTWYVCGGSYADTSNGNPTIPTLTLPDSSNWASETNVRAILQAAHYNESSVSRTITSAKLKVNGVWGDLIGNDIEDVDLG